MTTPAQLAAQIVDLMTRWNSQQDQLDDWLTGAPTGGPNGDGRYPLTNASGVTGLFLSLPAVIAQVTGPSAAAAAARDDAETAADAAQAAQAAASTQRAAAETARNAAQAAQVLGASQAADVAAKWAAVNATKQQIDDRFAGLGKITLSATAPASPVNNDLWFRTGASPGVFARVAGAWVQL